MDCHYTKDLLALREKIDPQRTYRVVNESGSEYEWTGACLLEACEAYDSLASAIESGNKELIRAAGLRISKIGLDS